jgi:hypothetical protein
MRLSDFLFTDLVNTGATATPNVQTTTTTGIDSNGPATFAFDGSTASRSYISGTIGSWFVFRPETAIPVTTSLRVFTEGGNTSQIWLNGSNSNFTNTGTTAWQDIPLNGVTSIENISVQGNPSSSASATLYAIEVTDANGTRILTNPFIYSADLFTAPPNAAIPANPTDQNFNDTDADSSQNDAFNGDNSTGALSDEGGGSWIQFRPENEITATTSLSVRCQTTQTIAVNGTDTTLDQTADSLQTVDLSAQLTFPLDIETLSIRGNNGNNPRLCTIIVDGQELTNGVNNSYGVNGFHLDFSDPDDIGNDSSGNGNDFTATGFELADDDDPDYDLMQDSPTQNYATLNPVIAGPFGFSTVAANLADANLQLGTPSAGSTDPTAIPTQVITGRKYFETNIVSGNSALTLYLQPEGVNPENATVQQNRIVRVGGANTGAASGIDINNADGTAEASTTAPAGVRVISLDVDTDTGNVRVFLNGTLQGTGTGYTGTRVLHYIVNGQTGAYEVYFNGGQQPFLHRPAELDDTNNLQTQNMPAAPIANGRDHFQALTGSGQGADVTPVANELPGDWSSDLSVNTGTLLTPGQAFNGNSTQYAQNNTGSIIFTPTPAIDYTTRFNVRAVWYPGSYVRVNGIDVSGVPTSGSVSVEVATGSGTINSIEVYGGSSGTFIYEYEVDATASTGGGGDILVDYSILALAQQAFDTGLWWVKSRVTDANTNEHQLVDSIDGATSCRQLNARTTGAYTAPAGNSVAWCWNWDQANPQTNGFNIVDFNATGDPVTLDTGLDNPECIIFYSTSSANTFSGFRALGNGFFELNNPQQFLAGNSIQWQTGANAGEVIVDGAYIGGDGKLFAWQSIPGYSAFGDFQGNSNNNGSFIYLGFRPQMLMIRTTGDGDSFFIVDSTRSPNNPIGADGLLNAGSTDPEGTWSARDIDFLSNGFKLRSSSGSVNGGTVVYAAWAENPFGSSNTSPANAR